MPLTVVYLLVKLTSLICFYVFFFFFKGSVISALGLTVLLNTCVYVIFYCICTACTAFFSNK